MVPFPFQPILKFLDIPKTALKPKWWFLRSPWRVSFTWTPTKWFFLSRPPPDREAVRAKLISSGVLGADAYVVVAGPANVYGHYVTTREEYAIQRYEGASTIFGQCECFYFRRAVLFFEKRFILLDKKYYRVIYGVALSGPI